MSSDSDIPTMSVNVKVVNVLASVRDNHGKIIPDLTKNDFTLQEDSHPDLQRLHGRIKFLVRRSEILQKFDLMIEMDDKGQILISNHLVKKSSTGDLLLVDCIALTQNLCRHRGRIAQWV